MSSYEALRLINGETVVNNTDHNKDNQRSTDSVGFCYFDWNDKDKTIYDYASKISGIADMEVCLVATPKDEYKHLFKKGYGLYARDDVMKEPTGKESTAEAFMMILDMIDIVAKELSDKSLRARYSEYSTKEYRLSMFKDWKIYTPDTENEHDRSKHIKYSSHDYKKPKLVMKGGVL